MLTKTLHNVSTEILLFIAPLNVAEKNHIF